MNIKKLIEKITIKQVIVFLIILVVGVVIAFIALNWNIFAESFSAGWNSR